MSVVDNLIVSNMFTILKWSTDQPVRLVFLTFLINSPYLIFYVAFL